MLYSPGKRNSSTYCGFLETNDLLSSKQLGFNMGRSTEDQLLTFVEVINEVEKGCLVDVVYLDFFKKLDEVNHEILLMKSRCVGFSDQVLGLIKEFLCNRHLYVTFARAKSDEKNIKSRIPQGSVLGPLLFLIYVNSIAESNGAKWYTFSHDFKLYRHI